MDSLRAIVLSNLPHHCCSENEIRRALLLYGTAVNIVVSGSPSNEAVVYMRTEKEAQAMCQKGSVMMAGVPVRVQPYTPLPPPVNNPPPVLPPSIPMHKMPMPQMNPPANGFHPMYPQPSSAPYRIGDLRHDNSVPTPPTLYRVNIIVENCQFPVTSNIIRDIFKQKIGCSEPTRIEGGPVGGEHGEIGGTWSGFVDFYDFQSAQLVVQEFNHHHIYDGFGLLRLSLAKSSPMFYPPDPAYSNPPPVPQPQFPPSPAGLPPMLGDNGYHGYSSSPPQNPSSAPMQSPIYLPENAAYSPPPMHPAPPSSMPPFPPNGDWDRGMVTRGRGRGRGGRGGRGGFGMDMDFAYQDRGISSAGYRPDDAYHMFSSMPGNGQAFVPGAPSSPDTTVIVGSVSENASLYELWVLLEVYGNVNSLKRQYKSRMNVVAQFQNPLDAKAAVSFLQGCPFRGNMLSLKHFAGYVERGVGRTEWNSGPATDPKTLAVLFTSGFHHRTKPSEHFNHLGRLKPERNIYISNLTEAITDEEVKSLCTAIAPVVDFCRRKPTIAIVSFLNVEEAVNVLVAMHAKTIRDRYLRVTFSRFPPGYQTGTGDEDIVDDNINHSS